MMPEVLRDYSDSVDQSELSKMLKQLAAITEESGFDKAVESLTVSIANGVNDSDSVLAIHRMINDEYPEIAELNGKRIFRPCNQQKQFV